MSFWNNLTLSDKWLAVFVGSIVVTFILLLVDFVLDRLGFTTITQLTKEHPILEVPIIGWQLFSALALHFHFYYYDLNLMN